MGAVCGVAVRREPVDECGLKLQTIEGEGQHSNTSRTPRRDTYPVIAAVLERVVRVLVQEVGQAGAVLHRDLVRGRLKIIGVRCDEMPGLVEGTHAGSGSVKELPLRFVVVEEGVGDDGAVVLVGASASGREAVRVA